MIRCRPPHPTLSPKTLTLKRVVLEKLFHANVSGERGLGEVISEQFLIALVDKLLLASDAIEEVQASVDRLAGRHRIDDLPARTISESLQPT